MVNKFGLMYYPANLLIYSKNQKIKTYYSGQLSNYTFLMICMNFEAAGRSIIESYEFCNNLLNLATLNYDNCYPIACAAILYMYAPPAGAMCWQGA